MIATLIKVNGEVKQISPKNGKKFSLEEAQGYVGGFVELVRLRDNRIMLCNEEGAINGSSHNKKATIVACQSGYMIFIFGDVVICDTTMF